jgi:transposase, IS30 family
VLRLSVRACFGEEAEDVGFTLGQAEAVVTGGLGCVVGTAIGEADSCSAGDLFGQGSHRRAGGACEELDGLVERVRGVATRGALGEQRLGEAYAHVGALGDGAERVECLDGPSPGRNQVVVATSRGWRVAMGSSKRQRSIRAMRGPMRSPGRPPGWRREHRQRFWEAIARGVSSEEAAAVAGVASAVGTRWFREGGGMPTVSPAPLSGRYLSFAEREEIAILHAQHCGVREIARRIGRSPSTVSRELRRNAATRSGAVEYRATNAQWHADRRARRPKISKLAASDALCEYVQDRLAGMITAPDGATVPGPPVRWIGRRHGRRTDRRWATSWSPEQVSNRLRVDFPDDESMRISHEAIYQALYVQGRGALRRELVACLRTGRALRVPRARTRGRGKKFVSPEIMISERPVEAEDRAVPGHWEGDLIVGLDSSAIGTLVERTTRFTMLLHLPPMDGHGDEPRVKNGPALAGHGAEAVRDAIAASIVTLPDQLRRSLTWDQGTEMAQHAQLRIDTGLAIYFCDPHSPWQRGTNENTNGLLRQYFPKGTDLSKHSPNDLAAVAAALNGRPRKTLAWRTPAEALNDLLRSAQHSGSVARTP